MRRTSTHTKPRSIPAAAIEWLCYRLPSDTDAEYVRRVAEMSEAFAAASRRVSHV